MGKFQTCELEPENYVSATQIRVEVSKKVKRSEEFRAGVIYGAYNNFPVVYSTIDVAIMNEDYTQVLLGKKPEDKGLRFIGGFVEEIDEDIKDTVKREAYEETGLEIGKIKYICSKKINDWRYKGETNRSIMTHFHIAKKIFGVAKANDDISEIKWVNISDLTVEMMAGEHKKLLPELLKILNK